MGVKQWKLIKDYDDIRLMRQRNDVLNNYPVVFRSKLYYLGDTWTQLYIHSLEGDIIPPFLNHPSPRFAYPPPFFKLWHPPDKQYFFKKNFAFQTTKL